jgi:trans-L-3-hydroxyproline dehydratase
MYGAILIRSTGLVDAGEFDIRVLFMTNDGYFPMCGHPTLAPGRFLIDVQNHTVKTEGS